MASVLAVDHPIVTLSSWANFLVASNRHHAHTIPRPVLVMRMSSSCSFSPLDPLLCVKVFFNSVLATETFIPATFNSAVRKSAATGIIAESKTSDNRGASATVFSHPLLPGTSRMSPPAIVFLQGARGPSGDFFPKTSLSFSAYSSVLPLILPSPTKLLRSWRELSFLQISCASGSGSRCLPKYLYIRTF